jgi:hypothetical protein
MKTHYLSIIAVILMIAGVFSIVGGYVGLTVPDACPCAANSDLCYCCTHEDPIARGIIYLGISIIILGVILFIITAFKKRL